MSRRLVVPQSWVQIIATRWVFAVNPALPLVGSMGFDQPLELVPRQMLQQGMEYAILVRHGVAPFVSRNVWRRPFTSRINAVHHVSKNRAGQSWPWAWHDDVAVTRL